MTASIDRDGGSVNVSDAAANPVASSDMQDDTEVRIATIEPDAQVVIAEEVLPPAPITTDALIQACRLLQQRIPGFDQLSAEERQRLVRVASLNPEFLAAGIEGMCVCDDYRAAVGYSGEELRELSARIERRAELQREFQRLADGVGAALLKERHDLGNAVLIFYSMLGMDLRHPRNAAKRHMRPYYEDMKRAYMKNRKTRRKTAPEPAEP
jgi:hypothetical protein